MSHSRSLQEKHVIDLIINENKALYAYRSCIITKTKKIYTNSLTPLQMRKFHHNKILSIVIQGIIISKLILIIVGLFMIVIEGVLNGGFNNASFGIAG